MADNTQILRTFATIDITVRFYDFNVIYLFYKWNMRLEWVALLFGHLCVNCSVNQ